MSKGKCADPAKEAERARKISEARKRRMAEQGFLNSAETRSLMSAAKVGTAQSGAHKANISAALKGRLPANHAEALAAAHAIDYPTGEAHPSWKGDEVGYGGLHIWMRKEFGTPSKCERCGTETAKRYEWANKSRTYKRERADWERLCVPCHRNDGIAHGEYPSEPWNKGRGLRK